MINHIAVSVLQTRKPTPASVRRRVGKMIQRDLQRGDTEAAARLVAYLATLGL